MAERAAAGVGKVRGTKKTVGNVPRAKKPTLDDVISAVETMTELYVRYFLTMPHQKDAILPNQKRWVRLEL